MKSIMISEILDFLEGLAPAALADKWDNTGLMTGSRQKRTGKVLFCLDLTEDVFNEACDSDAGLVITHHPLIFPNIGNIDEDTPEGRLITKIIKRNMTVFAAHTNLDYSSYGPNAILADMLGLGSPQSAYEYIKGDIRLPLVSCRCYMPALFRSFAGNLKAILGSDDLRIIGNVPEKVTNITIMCGSYDKACLEAAHRASSDLIISGDIKYHHALEILAHGACAIDAGHYCSEIPAMAMLSKTVGEKFTDLEITFSRTGSSPFHKL
ncbi:MAG: Nif3-like dinuclear metal center hexameric protein [Eubacteriales bacterium]|nr:Nif3-like dinuclear metal center hexameric protein [Eubacteriales bacterium]